MTSSAPSCFTKSMFALDDVAITYAPRDLASRTAKSPTAPAPPCIRTRSPFCNFALTCSPCHAVSKLIGTEAASMWEREDGFRERFDGFVMQNSAVAPSAYQSLKPKTASPRL